MYKTITTDIILKNLLMKKSMTMLPALKMSIMMKYAEAPAIILKNIGGRRSELLFWCFLSAFHLIGAFWGIMCVLLFFQRGLF